MAHKTARRHGFPQRPGSIVTALIFTTASCLWLLGSEMAVAESFDAGEVAAKQCLAQMSDSAAACFRSQQPVAECLKALKAALCECLRDGSGSVYSTWEEILGCFEITNSASDYS